MKQKTRFSNLEIGDEFDWGGKTYRKTHDRRAISVGIPRLDPVFSKTDLVTIEVPVEDDEDFYPMFGITGSGSANPNFGTPPFSPSSGGWGSSGSLGSSGVPGTIGDTGLTADELEDMYGIDLSGGDTCN